MGIGYEIGSAIAGAATDIFKTGYDVWTNQRDFDYQKSLQNDIFAREDNAIQRRVADLKAAGLNPNLAAGSAAGAGAVVGRSNTPGLSGNPVGTALDMAQHVQQLRQQRTENEILKNQKSESDAKSRLANNEALLDNLYLNTMLGLKSGIGINKDGEMYVKYEVPNMSNGAKWLNTENSPLMAQLKWQFQNNKNSADLLQKDVDWYTADKVGQYLGRGVQLFSGIGSGLYNFQRRR